MVVLTAQLAPVLTACQMSQFECEELQCSHVTTPPPGETAGLWSGIVSLVIRTEFEVARS